MPDKWLTWPVLMGWGDLAQKGRSVQGTRNWCLVDDWFVHSSSKCIYINCKIGFDKIWRKLCGFGEPGSSVGIATDYGLDGPRDRIPVGRDFPPVQTGPGAHPASCTMGTGSFPGVKYGRSVLLTTHPLLVPRSWKSRAIPLPTLWATTGPVTGFYLYVGLTYKIYSVYFGVKAVGTWI